MRKPTLWERLWFRGDDINIFVWLKDLLKDLDECPEGYYRYLRELTIKLIDKDGDRYTLHVNRYFMLSSLTITIVKNDKLIETYDGSSYGVLLDTYLGPLKDKKERDIDKKRRERKRQKALELIKEK